jgi:hypothetical protein
MKKCVVEVSIDANNQVQKNAFGNRWRNGDTTLILRPMLPTVGGFWDSDRQIDIDSAAGTDHAFFLISSNVLYVKTGGYDGDNMKRTHMKLYGFSMKVGDAGSGTFYFRQKEWDINWMVRRYD